MLSASVLRRPDRSWTAVVEIAVEVTRPDAWSVIERAPDDGLGAPDTANIERVAELPPGQARHLDRVKRVALNWWYRARHEKSGWNPSAFTDWVSAAPSDEPEVDTRILVNTIVAASAIWRANRLFVAYEGASATRSVRIATSTTSYPAPGTGTIVNSQAASFDAGTFLYGNTVFITITPYAGANATGAQGPVHQFTARLSFRDTVFKELSGRIDPADQLDSGHYILRANESTGKETPGDLFVPAINTVKVGTVASPASLTRAIRFHHAEFVPVAETTSFLYDILDLRPDSLLAEQFVAPVVLPKGITITKVRARGYREGRPPQVSSVTTTAFGSDTTDHNVSMPASVVSGDLLLMLFTSDDNPTHTTPTGWTLLGSATAGPDTLRMSVYGRVADGTEGGTTVNVVTSVAETAAAHVYRIITWSGSLAGVELSSFASNTNVNPNPASLSPSWGDPTLPRTLWLAVFGENNQSTVSTYPTNYTNGTFTASGGTNGCGVGSSRRQRDIETEDPGAFTLAASQDWVAVTIAVRPSLIDSLDALSMILYRQVSDGATNIATVQHDSAGWQTKEASLSQLVGEEAYTLLLSLNADVSPQDVRFQHAEIEYTRPDYAQTY